MLILKTNIKKSSIIISLLLAVFISHSAIAGDIDGIVPPVPSIDAQSYILIDYDSGEVIAERKADARYQPASLTKIMTSYVVAKAINSGTIERSDIVNIDKDSWSVGNPELSGSSLMFLEPGDLVSVDQLSRGIIIQSGNDACVAIAKYLAGGQDSFISLMNDYAKSMHMRNTHFSTVHGLDTKGQYSSARDMAILSRALIHDAPSEYAIYKEKAFTFNNIRQTNRNGLLWDSSLHVDGVKTGHTEQAGYNLVTSATKDGMRLISVVMGGHTYQGREVESRKLLTWGFRFFSTVSPVDERKELVSQRVWFGDKNFTPLGLGKRAYVTVPSNRVKDIEVSYTMLDEELRAPITYGQAVGRISFMLDGDLIQQKSLLAMQQVQRGNIFRCIIDYIQLFFHRLLK